MPLMIGSDAAFSLPCWGSSMAIVAVPLELSPGAFGVLGVSAPPLLAPGLAAPPLLAAGLDAPPPLLAAGLGVVLPVLLHAANAKTATLASALTLRKFIHCPPHHRSGGNLPGRSRSVRPLPRPVRLRPPVRRPWARSERRSVPSPLRGSTDSWSSGG